MPIDSALTIRIFLTIAVGFIISFAATPIVKSFAEKVGAMDVPGEAGTIMRIGFVGNCWATAGVAHSSGIAPAIFRMVLLLTFMSVSLRFWMGSGSMLGKSLEMRRGLAFGTARTPPRTS